MSAKSVYPKQIKVRVTRAAIKAGERKRNYGSQDVAVRATSCPIAQALKAAGWQNVSVRSDLVFVRKYARPAPQAYEPSRSVCRFIYAADNGNALKPATFVLKRVD